MRAEKKGKRTWFYISEEDEARLEKLAQSTGLAPAFLVSALASAGIRACADNNYRIHLPPRFELKEASAALDQPALPYRTTKPKK